jgi:hypothetical protein
VGADAALGAGGKYKGPGWPQLLMSRLSPSARSKLKWCFNIYGILTAYDYLTCCFAIV